MLAYPATIPQSARSLTHLAELLRAHRARRGIRYRRLDPGRQALLVPALLRSGDTPARLAAGFAVTPTTAWATSACRRPARRDRYADKHHGHGVNAQAIADPAGRLRWTSPALPGSTHDLTAARTHGIVDILATARAMTFADKGYRGAGGTVRTPFKHHHRRPRLLRRQKAVNRAHAKVRSIGGHAIFTVTCWKLLAKLRCCP